QQSDIVNSIFAIMLFANIFMGIIGLAGIRFFVKALSVPKQIIVPVVLTLSVVGSYSMNNSIFDVFVTIVFGIIGYLMLKADVIVSPIVLAVILGPMAETNYRRALIMFDGDMSFLYNRPITVVFLALAIFTIVSSLFKQKLFKRGVSR
ncbi:MAG TPA: C4-dicarboxylate ABC transporter permease, partial [Sphaerochaeta sp.]|nr:C4-dicarboxylate ABC transporter permease [Sphaerochaeta sp.]